MRREFINDVVRNREEGLGNRGEEEVGEAGEDREVEEDREADRRKGENLSS